MTGLLKVVTEFEERRGERRSFYCSNKLWKRMIEATNDCYSISTFICKAIKEKLERDFTENIPDTIKKIYK